MFKLKKIISIIALIIVASAMGYGLYYLFFKPATEKQPVIVNVNVEPPGVLPPVDIAPATPIVVPVTPEDPTTPSALPVSDIAAGGETNIKSVVKENIQSPILDKNTGNIFYYDKGMNEFYKVDADGRRELFSEKKFYNVKKINWSPDNNKAILEYPDGNKILYDFEKEKQVTLDKSWYDFSFSASSNEIELKIDDDNPDYRWLATANTDGTGLRLIEHLGENADKVQVAWSPNNQIAAFSTTGNPMGYDRQEVLLLGFNGENFRSTIVEGRGFEAQWAPQGDKIIYNVWNVGSGYKPTLWSVEAEGENIGNNRKDLGLQTWSDKCTFSSDNVNIYCAVPRYLPDGAGLIPEAATGADDFYKVNINSGSKTFLAKPSAGEYNVSDIFLSAEEDYLYFTDKNTEQLYKIQLK